MSVFQHVVQSNGIRLMLETQCVDMEDGESRAKKKAAIITGVILVICVLVSVTLNAVSVGVVENLPVSFSRSTINYGVQGSQLYQTGEVKSRGRLYFPRKMTNLSECDTDIFTWVKKISVCVKNKTIYIVLSEISVETGEEHMWYFTLIEWRSFLGEALDITLQIATGRTDD